MARWSIHLDTNALISFIESDTDRAIRLFDMVRPGLAELFTSELSLLDVLVGPLKDDDGGLVSAYEELVTDDETLHVVPIDRAILRGAAQRRADFGGKTPDAIHVATAANCNCNIPISTDRRLRLPAAVARVAVDDVADLGKWP